MEKDKRYWVNKKNYVLNNVNYRKCGKCEEVSRLIEGYEWSESKGAFKADCKLCAVSYNGKKYKARSKEVEYYSMNGQDDNYLYH